MSISIPTPNSCQFWCLDTKKRVDFDPDTKTKWFSTPHNQNTPIPITTSKSSQLRSPHWNRINFDHQQKKTSAIDPPSKNQDIFDPPQKSSQFRSPLSIQVDYDASTQIKFYSDLDTRPCRVRSPHKNKANSDPYTEIKSSSSLAFKPGQFRPPMQKWSHVQILHWNQVIFAHLKKQVKFDHPHKNQVNRSPIGNKSFSARTVEPSQFRWNT